MRRAIGAICFALLLSYIGALWINFPYETPTSETTFPTVILSTRNDSGEPLRVLYDYTEDELTVILHLVNHLGVASDFDIATLVNYELFGEISTLTVEDGETAEWRIPINVDRYNLYDIVFLAYSHSTNYVHVHRIQVGRLRGEPPDIQDIPPDIIVSDPQPMTRAEPTIQGLDQKVLRVVNRNEFTDRIGVFCVTRTQAKCEFENGVVSVPPRQQLGINLGRFFGGIVVLTSQPYEFVYDRYGQRRSDIGRVFALPHQWLESGTSGRTERQT